MEPVSDQHDLLEPSRLRHRGCKRGIFNEATVPTPVTTTPLEIDLDAYSIEEFCKRHSISRGTYYNMKGAGSGPREKHAMGRVLITREAAQDWRVA